MLVIIGKIASETMHRHLLMLSGLIFCTPAFAQLQSAAPNAAGVGPSQAQALHTIHQTAQPTIVYVERDRPADPPTPDPEISGPVVIFHHAICVENFESLRPSEAPAVPEFGPGTLRAGKVFADSIIWVEHAGSCSVDAYTSISAISLLATL